jgi:sulfide:quinone oxidoreductase
MKASARVVICGGGVAAMEALLALREVLPLPLHPHIDLVAPNSRFVYQPMAVAEPFGLARTRLFEIKKIAHELRSELHVGSLVRVDHAERSVELDSGISLPYDAAIVAVGARREPWLKGASSFGGTADAPAFAGLLERLEQGGIGRLAFTSPPGASWTLPLYELALLTASRLAERGVTGVELTVITPETEPLAIFGVAASRMLGGLLSDRGIRLRAGATVETLLSGRAELSSGETIEVDEMVALPVLRGPSVPGLQADADGFIEVDEHCRVAGLEDVYAAGDGTSFPIKQGGIATQQAGVAVEWLAAGLDAPLKPSPFKPVLRGMLLTGLAPMYLRARVAAEEGESGTVAANALWWPPTKIAGRYLGPYLARSDTLGERASLEDRAASTRDPALQREGHRESRELALLMAESDARDGDFRSALSWLEVIEQLDGVLPAGYLQKRDTWESLVGSMRGFVPEL